MNKVKQIISNNPLHKDSVLLRTSDKKIIKVTANNDERLTIYVYKTMKDLYLCVPSEYKVFKVKNDSEYVYKIQKTQIKAKNGALGIVKHFYECLENDFAVNAWVIEPLKTIYNNVKPVWSE